MEYSRGADSGPRAPSLGLNPMHLWRWGIRVDFRWCKYILTEDPNSEVDSSRDRFPCYLVLHIRQRKRISVRPCWVHIQTCCSLCYIMPPPNFYMVSLCCSKLVKAVKGSALTYPIWPPHLLRAGHQHFLAFMHSPVMIAPALSRKKERWNRSLNTYWKVRDT